MIPKDLLFIILGGIICIAYYSWQDYKRKKKEKMQDRLNLALSNINHERNKRHE